jgi:hypothetical protein
LPTLHVHLDEAGDLEFSLKGTAYYVFAVTWTYNPLPLASTLSNLRFGLNKAGFAIHQFHANPDPPPRRRLVLSAMVSDPHWYYAAVVVEKRKVHPSIRAPQHFYPKFARMPLHLVLGFRVRPGTSQVMIYTRYMPVSGKPRAAIEGAIKIACRAHLSSHTPFHIFHHPNTSNCWLQVTDYCCWAVQRKWEKAFKLRIRY